MNNNQLHELASKQAIRDTLSRYCRGLDRMDKAMARSVWHDHGTAHYIDMFEGSGHGFVDWVWQAHEGMERHSHQISNVLIEVEDNTAISEAYVTVVLWTNPDNNGQQQEIIGRSRYLDRWSLRNQRWAIDHRTHVLDMQTIQPLTRGEVNKQSSRDLDDVSYSLLKPYGQ
jgi:hypothetical protein